MMHTCNIEREVYRRREGVGGRAKPRGGGGELRTKVALLERSGDEILDPDYAMEL